LVAPRGHCGGRRSGGGTGIGYAGAARSAAGQSLICYEAIFPHEVAAKPLRPAWLLNVTNDAWFGLTAGPHQDFSMARMRTIEEGLPLARAANNGISAIVDPYGAIVDQLGLGRVGIIDSGLPEPLPPTLYSRVGDISFFLFWLQQFFALSLTVRLRSGN